MFHLPIPEIYQVIIMTILIVGGGMLTLYGNEMDSKPSFVLGLAMMFLALSVCIYGITKMDGPTPSSQQSEAEIPS